MNVVGSKPRPKLVTAMIKRREELGKTQVQVARACRISQATISRIEKDKNAPISERVAARLEKWLQVAGAKRVLDKRLTKKAA